MQEALIKIPSTKEISRFNDLDSIRKLLDVAEIVSRYNLTIPETVELTRKRGYLVVRAGEVYDGLDPERGDKPRDQKDSLTQLTNPTSKQAAEAEIGKSRPTIAKWVRISRKLKPYQKVDEYCDHQLGILQEASLAGLFHYLDGIIEQKHTGNNENYTPAWVIEKVREVMGEIDLDPASCEVAQKVVKAKTYLTAEDNSLQKDCIWKGRIFLNPPYAAGLINHFIEKLVTSHYDEAILLTNNNTDTKWFHMAAMVAGVICFTSGRINFYTEEKEETFPTNGQTFFYFGKNDEVFCKVFANVGLLVRVI